MHGTGKILIAAVVSVAILASTAASHPAVAVPDAFDYAFRFASALDPDPKDKGAAQAGVVLAIAEAGDLDRATELSDEVTGWRKGTVYADLAVMHVRAGDPDRALDLVARAREVRSVTDGWQGGRIEAHVAQAMALLGDRDGAREIAARLAKGDIQYAGRSVATVASGHAFRGDHDEAMQALATLDAETDYEVTWWRTLGYLDVAGVDGLDPARRDAALDAALRSAGGIPGWKMGEGLHRVASALLRAGRSGAARETLTRAEQAIGSMPSTTPVKGPLLAGLAATWGRLGEIERGRGLLDEARKAIEGALSIERPAIYAAIGAGYHDLGDRDTATEFYDSALLRAEELVNARPRALAATTICASMGEHGVPLDDATRGRLDRLFAGLRAPW